MTLPANLGGVTDNILKQYSWAFLLTEMFIHLRVSLSPVPAPPALPPRRCEPALYRLTRSTLAPTLQGAACTKCLDHPLAPVQQEQRPPSKERERQGGEALGLQAASRQSSPRGQEQGAQKSPPCTGFCRCHNADQARLKGRTATTQTHQPLSQCQWEPPTQHSQHTTATARPAPQECTGAERRLVSGEHFQPPLLRANQSSTQRFHPPERARVRQPGSQTPASFQSRLSEPTAPAPAGAPVSCWHQETRTGLKPTVRSPRLAYSFLCQVAPWRKMLLISLGKLTEAKALGMRTGRGRGN